MRALRAKDPVKYSGYKKTGRPNGRPRIHPVKESTNASTIDDQSSDCFGFTGLYAVPKDEWRRKRDKAFKHNVKLYGLKKAKWIAWIVRKR